jgi:hypothetical protein
MGLRKPLVVNLTTGELEQLSPSDYLDERDIINISNETGAPLVVGTPVYQSATANEVAKAQANAIATAKVAGLILDASIADGATGGALTDGRITATTTQWDAVTGQTGGLTPGARYFLSAASAGMLTTTPPSVDGQVIAPIGTARSTTEFEISIGTRISL